MPEYDLNQMREEAARRAREMQSRARIPPQRNRTSPQQPAEAPPAPRPQQAPQAQEPPVPQPEEQGKPETSALEALFQDRERTVILALLILLSGEEGNHELLFALMFLLM